MKLSPILLSAVSASSKVERSASTGNDKKIFDGHSKISIYGGIEFVIC